MTGPQPSPKDLVRALIRTRQIREFTDEPMTAQEVDAFLEVARWTGSSNNQQPWRFVLVRDVAALRRMAEAGLPQTRPLLSAPAAIAITLPNDPSRAIHDAYDDGRVAERLLVAATCLGLGAGISWVRSDVRAAVAEILALPADRFVRTIVAIGHPTEEARKPKSTPGTARLPMATLVVEERWPTR